MPVSSPVAPAGSVTRDEVPSPISSKPVSRPPLQDDFNDYNTQDKEVSSLVSVFASPVFFKAVIGLEDDMSVVKEMQYRLELTVPSALSLDSGLDSTNNRGEPIAELYVLSTYDDPR